MDSFDTNERLKEILDQNQKSFNKATFIYVAAVVFIFSLLTPNIVYMTQLFRFKGNSEAAMNVMYGFSNTFLIWTIVACLVSIIFCLAYFRFPAIMQKPVWQKLIFCLGTITPTIIISMALVKIMANLAT